MASNYLPPIEQSIFDQMTESREKEFEHHDAVLVEWAASHNYSEKSVGFALWSLEKKGYIRKVRRGRKVYFSCHSAQELDGALPVQARSADAALQKPLQYMVTYAPDEDGYVVASVPALPGCHSQGRTKDEARRNIKEAIKGYVASSLHHGKPIPEEDVERVQVLP